MQDAAARRARRRRPRLLVEPRPQPQRRRRATRCRRAAPRTTRSWPSPRCAASSRAPSLEMVPHAGADHVPGRARALMIEMTARVGGDPSNWNILHVAAANRDEVTAKLAVSDRAATAGRQGRRACSCRCRSRLRLNFLSGFVLDMLPGWDKLMALPVREKLAMLRTRRRAGRSCCAAPSREHDPQLGRQLGDVQRSTEGVHRRRPGASRAAAVADIAREQGKDAVRRAHRHRRRRRPAHRDRARRRGSEPGGLGGPRPGAPRPARGRRRVRRRRPPRHARHVPLHHRAARRVRARPRASLSTEEAVHLLTAGARRALRSARPWRAPRGRVGRPRGVRRGHGRTARSVETRSDLPGGGRRLYAAAHGVAHVVVNGDPDRGGRRRSPTRAPAGCCGRAPTPRPPRWSDRPRAVAQTRLSAVRTPTPASRSANASAISSRGRRAVTSASRSS